MHHDETAHGSKDQRLIDVLPDSFWVAGASSSGGAANLGLVIDFTAAMNGAVRAQKEDDVRLVESAGTKESWHEKVEDSFHVRVETLSPAAFLDGAQGFLQAVGLEGLTQVSVDEEALPIGEDSVKLDLKGAVGACSDYLAKRGDSVRRIEITSHGRNEKLSLLLDFSYRRKHRPMAPPIELEVQAMSNEFGPREGEPFAEYRARMNALDSDPAQREKVDEEVAAQKKAILADYAHHLSEAFPGVRLQFYERLAPGQG